MLDNPFIIVQCGPVWISYPVEPGAIVNLTSAISTAPVSLNSLLTMTVTETSGISTLIHLTSTIDISE